MPCSVACGDEPVEVGRPCRGSGRSRRGRRPATPIAHGLPGSPGPRLQRVVAALAVRAADRVDRREVDDVEAELRELAAAARARRRSRPRSAGTARTRRRSGRARGRRRRSSGARRRRAVAVAGGRGERLLDRRAVPSRAAPRPPPARRRGPPGPRRPCGRSSSTARRDAVDPGLDAELPAPGRSTANEPAQRSLPSGSSGASASARAGRRVADGRAEHVVAVAEDPRRTSTAVADRPLDGIAAAVDLRLDVAESGSAAAARSTSARATSSTLSHLTLPRREASALAPASCSIRRRCPAGASARRRTGSSTGSRPPGSRGGRCCRSARRTSSARRTARRRRSRLAAAARRAGRAASRGPSSTTSSQRHPYWIGDWARFAGPGALADQVRFEREWCALRAYARERGVRLIGDVPIYVADEGADVETLAGAVRARRGRGRAAGRAERERPALGQPALRLAGAPRDRLSAGGSSGSGARSSSSTSARIDHFRGFVSYWAIPAAPRRRAAAGGGAGPGARALPTRSSSALGELPLIAEDLGVITPAVRRLRDELGLPGMAVLHLGVRRPPDKSAPAARTTARTRSSTRASHDTDTTAGWFREPEAGRAGGDRPRPRGAGWSSSSSRCRRAHRSR